MKTMTCRQLGGACDLPLRGATANEVIQPQDQHLKDVVAGGDDAHEPALTEMKGRWKRPVKGLGWYGTSSATSRRSPTTERGDGTDGRPQEPEPRLLSGGNPQIPKGEGDGPVQDYIAAMPGWKRELGRRLDDLIVRTVPDVHKAVKWNQPFYGFDGDGWFVSFRCYTKYVQLTFFRGRRSTRSHPRGPSTPRCGTSTSTRTTTSTSASSSPGSNRPAGLPGEKM